MRLDDGAFTNLRALARALRCGRIVLRIRRSAVAHGVVLLVEGHLAAEWADLLDRESRELIRSGLDVVLDLSGVVFVSPFGIEVLSRLSHSGVEIVRCPPLIADVLGYEGIEVGRDTGEKIDGVVPSNEEPQ